jgi:hypothetical protein
VVNTTLLPQELRPRLWQRISLVLGAVFFLTIGVLATYSAVPNLKAEAQKMFGSKADVAAK